MSNEFNDVHHSPPPPGPRFLEEPLELQILGAWVIAIGAALLAIGLMQEKDKLERRGRANYL